MKMNRNIIILIMGILILLILLSCIKDSKDTGIVVVSDTIISADR